MKIIGVPRINALGHKGPEDMSKAIGKELKRDFEILEVDNSDIEKSEEQILDKARGVLSNQEKAYLKFPPRVAPEVEGGKHLIKEGEEGN